MNFAADRDNSKTGRPRLLLAAVQVVRELVARLYGFFALTDDERLKGGIYLGSMEQDR